MPATPTTHGAPRDAPIACNLSPDELRDRTADLSALAQRALLSRRPTTHGERLMFIDTPEVERALRAAAAAEAACCSFLTMRLDRRDDGLLLDVTGPAEARPIIAGLFA
jgi:hypothetical protein